MPRVDMPINNTIKMPLHLENLVLQKLINIEVPDPKNIDNYDKKDRGKPKFIRIVFLNNNIELRNLVYEIFNFTAYAEESHERNGTYSHEIFLTGYSNFRKNAKTSALIPVNYFRDNPAAKKLSTEVVLNKIFTDKLELLRKRYYDVAMLKMADFNKTHGQHIKSIHKKNYTLNAPMTSDSITEISKTINSHQAEIDYISRALSYMLKQETTSPGEASQSRTQVLDEKKADSSPVELIDSSKPSSNLASTPVQAQPELHEQKSVNSSTAIDAADPSRREGELSTTVNYRTIGLPPLIRHSDALPNEDESDDEGDLAVLAANSGDIDYQLQFETSTDIEGKPNNLDNDEKEKNSYPEPSNAPNAHLNMSAPETTFSKELKDFIGDCVNNGHEFPMDVLDDESLKCSLSLDVCKVPVRVNGILYNLPALTKSIANFGTLASFQIPGTSVVVTKKDILPARDVLAKTIKYFDDWEMRIAKEGETETKSSKEGESAGHQPTLQFALASQAMDARNRLKKTNSPSDKITAAVNENVLIQSPEGIVAEQKTTVIPESRSIRIFSKSSPVVPAPVSAPNPLNIAESDSVKTVLPQATPAQDEDKLFVNTFIKKHSELYHQKFFLWRKSNFMSLLRDGRMNSVNDIVNFVKMNPKSRAATVLTQMEIKPDFPWANHIKNYLTLYRSRSHFFKTASLKNLQTGKLKTIEEAQDYANLNPTSTTAQALKKS